MVIAALLRRLGEILVQERLTTPDVVEEALARAKTTGERLGEALVALGAVKSEEVLRALAQQQNLAYLSRDELPSPLPIVKNLSAKYLRQYAVCPVSVENGQLTVATADPLNPVVVDDLRQFTGLAGKLVVSAAATAGRGDLAHQADGGDEHRRAAAAPGRAHPRDGPRPAGGHPRLHDPDHTRRVDRHAAARPLERVPGAREARLRAGHAPALRVAHQAPARYRARHRADGLRQDDDALRGARQDQLARPKDHHGRGPARISAPGRQPNPREAEDRAHVRHGAPAHRPAGPGRDPHRRDPRPRDRGDRYPGGAHRPPGLLDAPHERRARRDHATARYGRGGLSGRLRARRRARPAARAADLHSLPRPRHAQRRRPRGARDRGRGGPATLPRTRLRRVPRDRLPRAHRHLRAVPDHRRGAQPHPTARADPRHPSPRDRGGHGHPPDGRLAQGRRGRDDRRGNPPRHPGRRLVQMPVFVYQAADRRGQKIDGVMEAPDARAVVERLQKDSYFPIRVVPHAERARWLAFGVSARVGQRDLLALTQQLATLVESALPLDRALAIQEELAPNPRVKSIVGDLLNSVRGGSTLSEPLAKYNA